MSVAAPKAPEQIFPHAVGMQIDFSELHPKKCPFLNDFQS
jgi:hypothetical protein